MTTEGGRDFYKTHSGTIIKTPEQGETSDVVITGRPYGAVLESLAIDPSERRDDQVFLSLGDGLSDFPARFEEATGATVISSDPIYRVIRPTDTPDEARTKIQAAGLEGIAVTRNEKKMVPPKDWEHLRDVKRKGGNIVADVEHLPFQNEQLDGIMSAHALRYIDVTKCLSEFARVLKDTGEMRFGHPGFEVGNQGKDIIVYPDKKHSDEYRDKLIKFLAQFSEPLYCYMLFEQKAEGQTGTVQTLVLSKSDQQPTFAERTKITKEKPKNYAVARINFQDILTSGDGKSAWKAEVLR